MSDVAGLSVLLVDDDPLLRSQISGYLEKLGIDVTVVKDLQSARRMIADLDFDFVLLDVNLPDGTGTDLLKERVFAANTGVIVITAGGGVQGAVEAMRMGALDYLVKPFDIRELPLAINRARQMRQSARLHEHRRDTENKGQFYFGEALKPLEVQLEKIVAVDRRMESRLPPVLIQGETGTGKSTIARWLHHGGPRAEGPLVEINCSALPEQLAESELFGHERGAFTDARAARLGLFEAANGGTLFLDELPSLSLGLQAKLLTVIEDGAIRRLGGNKRIPVDVRLVAASNRDLKKLVGEGAFREDLFHRLDLYRIEIPPLRQRAEDIIRLASRLLEQLCRRHRIPQKRIHPEGRLRLLAYPWPGNVRELAHELERSIIFDESDELKFANLPAGTAGGNVDARADGQRWFGEDYRFPPQFSLEQAIYETIQHALKLSQNNVSAAARMLGVPRDYVRYRLSKKSGMEGTTLSERLREEMEMAEG